MNGGRQPACQTCGLALRVRFQEEHCRDSLALSHDDWGWRCWARGNIFGGQHFSSHAGMMSGLMDAGEGPVRLLIRMSMCDLSLTSSSFLLAIDLALSHRNWDGAVGVQASRAQLEDVDGRVVVCGGRGRCQPQMTAQLIKHLPLQ